MQHPDEGTIHAWLDGQLPPDETAALEAHVAECPQCAAKVAEERGIAAGATRILTALDDVPRDVIPIAAERTRVSRRVLQAAAAILVVATGGLIAVRVSGNDVAVPSTATTVAAPVPANIPQTAPVNGSVPAARPATVAPAPAATTPSNFPPQRKSVPLIALRGSVPSADARSGSDEPGNKNAASPTAMGAVATIVSPPATLRSGAGLPTRDTTDGGVPERDNVALQPVATSGVASFAASKLSIVRSDTIGGVRRIFLRTETGKVAVLTESASPPADAVAEPGPATASARAATRAAVQSRAAETRMITWKDGTTGKFHSLSGPFAEEELQRLRARIEADPVLRDK